jgi:hypothetical protein
MKPKIKERLCDVFSVAAFWIGFSIHGLSSLCFLMFGAICGAFALYFLLLNHRIHTIDRPQARNWAWLLFVVLLIGTGVYWKQSKEAEPQVTPPGSKPVDVEKSLGSNEFRAIVVNAVKDVNSTEQYAESNNRVLQTKVSELEAKAQWRTITAKQEDDFIEALTKSPKGKVIICFVINDQESFSLAQQIRDLLKISEFEVLDNLISFVPIKYDKEGLSAGVEIGVKSTDNIPPCAIFLQRAFERIGIKAPIAYTPAKSDFDVCITVFSKSQNSTQ